MDEHNRIKRPAPERTEPKRQWGAGFEPPRADSPGNGGPSDPRDAAYQTINDAYRLIDDYMRQGQQVAENFWMPVGGAAAPFREAPERFMRALGDMTMAWVEVMQQWTATSSGSQTQAATGRAGPFAGVESGIATNGAATNGAATSSVPSDKPEVGSNVTPPLRVTVLASSPMELVVDLAERVDVGSVQLTELRDSAGLAVPLTDVSVQRGADGVPFVKVVVPEDQPPGTYNGLFIDQTTRRPRGTLSLTLLPRG